MYTKITERFIKLIDCDSEKIWREQIFKLGYDLGYEQMLLAIFPNHHTPMDAKLAFLHSNYSSEWLEKYQTQQLGKLDPVVAHCINKFTPLIWSPDIFSVGKQKEMYEEACAYGLRSGVTLPIHGLNGEMGILCFVNDCKPDDFSLRTAHNALPVLSCFRDFIFESSLRYIKPLQSQLNSPSAQEEIPHITPRELVCLKWCALGKSSPDISKILNCSVPAVNLHIANLRRKFKVNSRQQVVVKALHLKLLHN